MKENVNTAILTAIPFTVSTSEAPLSTADAATVLVVSTVVFTVLAIVSIFVLE